MFLPYLVTLILLYLLILLLMATLNDLLRYYRHPGHCRQGHVRQAAMKLVSGLLIVFAIGGCAPTSGCAPPNSGISSNELDRLRTRITDLQIRVKNLEDDRILMQQVQQAVGDLQQRTSKLEDREKRDMQDGPFLVRISNYTAHFSDNSTLSIPITYSVVPSFYTRDGTEHPVWQLVNSYRVISFLRGDTKSKLVNHLLLP